MHRDLKLHLDCALQIYTSKDYLDDLMYARKEYFTLVGQAIEEDEDYESMMNSFNNWYLLQYISKKSIKTWIKDYSLLKGIEEEILYSFSDYNHSLFEYLGINMAGQQQYVDILHEKKLLLAKEHPAPALLKHDIFIGRVLNYQNQNYMMIGMTILPKNSKNILRVEAKRVRELKNHLEEIKFLFKVKRFQNRYKRYTHLDVSKVFRF